MSIKLITDKDKGLFNKLAVHPIQSWEWGEFRGKEGHKIVRLGQYEGDKLIKVFQLTFHKIPFFKFTAGHLAQCDLVDALVIEELKKIGRDNNAIFIKVEPSVILSEEKRAEEEDKLLLYGLKPGKSIFIRSTSEIDLTKSEKEIFDSFKNKTRYNIRVAEKHGVTIGQDNSDSAFENYLNLLFETTSRQGFFSHNQGYHRLQWQILRPAGISHLLTAVYQDEILASFLVFVFNNILYYPYGASTREHREVMAPTLLMWEAMKFGKKIGCNKFDLWGDIDVNSLPPNHPYQGFHRFKEGFSPTLVKLIATHDLVLNQTVYKLYNFVDTLRWKLLKLKAKLE